MKRPGVGRTRRRVIVPELGQQERASGGVEATGIRHGGRIGTAEGNIGRTRLEISPSTGHQGCDGHRR